MTTVRTEAPTDDLSALGLARRAARAAQAPATVLDMAAASIALSLADPPLPRFAVQIGTAEPEPAAGTVPLASADTLPDDAVDAAMRLAYASVHAAVTPRPTKANRDVARALYGQLAEALRERFPDETPTQPEAPAPFVRGVDELTDDEVNEDARGAWPWTGVDGFDGQYMGFLRDFATAIAARLRVDGPGREPAEITAAMLDAAHVGATVEDEDDDPVARVDDTRRALIAAVLRAASRRVEAEIGGTPHPLELARGLVDAAARVHVTALDGPATGGIIAAPGFTVTDEDVDSFFDAQRDSGDRTRVSLRDFERRAMEHYARRLASRSTGSAIVAPRGLPALSEADVEYALDLFVRTRMDQRNAGAGETGARRDALRTALGWYRLRLAGGTQSTGGYDPAKLASRSVVVAEDEIYVLNPSGEDVDNIPWMQIRGAGDWDWASHRDVPTDGVLLLDGATLGGGQ